MCHRFAVTAALLFLLAGANNASAQDEAPTGKLVAAGFGMAIPTYWIGVSAHEGSHALAAKMLGARVNKFSVLPGRYGPKKRFYFGYVSVSGLRTTRQRTFFWLAPKMTDMIVVGGYAALTLTGNLPENRYGALALTVLATGFVIDFGKDFWSLSRGNDVVKSYNANGYKSELSRFPFRLTQLALTALGGYVVYKGYSEVFEDRDDPSVAIMPLWSGSL